MNDKISIIIINDIKYILTDYYLYKGKEKKSLLGFGKGMLFKGKYIYVWTTTKVLRLNTLKWDRGFIVKGYFNDIRSVCKIEKDIFVILKDKIVCLKKGIIKTFKKGQIEDAHSNGKYITIQYIRKNKIKNCILNSNLEYVKIEK